MIRHLQMRKEIISFIFIPWIRTRLQNPYGYGLMDDYASCS